MGLVGAYSLKLTALQYTKQGGLHGQRQFADLIQKQRAGAGHFKFTQPIFDGSRKGASDVSEKLAFNQVLRKRGAIDRDEGFVRSRREIVQPLGNQFFTYSGFAGNQHREVA
ncbi:hypothetical protein ALP64_203691 [Pseudomonas syringae pv. actinidiae]|nr:hypothetical protein ALP64_203691 [Pseudomonas syringae pv. actinidiae]